MTLRPTWPTKWGASLFLIAVAGGFLGLGIRDWIADGYDLSGPVTLAAIIAALGVVNWRMYIRADETTIDVGFGWSRRYYRREVATIEIGRFVTGYYTGSGRPVRFLRSDGSVLFKTSLFWWGRDQLDAFAAYLGVPIARPGVS